MTVRILVLLAHPDLAASRVNRAMVERISDLPGVTVRRLYDLYPDFRIDVPLEQRLCSSHDHIVFQHPLYWYSCPALLKEWIDRVLQRGWAYGEGGLALKGKVAISVVSAAAAEHAYATSGKNRYTICEFLAPFKQTANLCNMRYLPPFVFYGARGADDRAIAMHAQVYRDKLLDFQSANGKEDPG